MCFVDSVYCMLWFRGWLSPDEWPGSCIENPFLQHSYSVCKRTKLLCLLSCQQLILDNFRRSSRLKLIAKSGTLYFMNWYKICLHHKEHLGLGVCKIVNCINEVINMKIRKYLYPLVALYILASCIRGLGASTLKGSKGMPYVPGEVIVKFRKPSPGIPGTTLRRYLQGVNSLFSRASSISRITGIDNLYKITFTAPIDVVELCAELKNRSDIEYAEPDYLGSFCATLPDDPSFSEQWYLHNTGQSGGTPGVDIKAPEAWDLETGDPDIVVAVIDTGVDYSHPELSPNIWHNPGEIPDDGVDNDANGYVDDVIGWDFVSVPQYWTADDEDAGPEDNDPMDRAGHGTYCAGVIASVGNNAVGLSGVTWHCKIMAVRVGFRRSDGTSSFQVSDAAKGIRYAVDNGADVINLSWIIRGASEVVADAIRYAYSKGVVVIGAVGNDDTKGAIFPSSMPEVISVAATDDNDNRAIWLQPQPPMPGEGSNFGIGIDVAAPGTGILTTDLDSRYVEINGTSASTAITSGVAALILSRHPNFSPAQVKSILRSTSEPELSSEKYIGYGRIDAYRALLEDDVPEAQITSIEDGEMISGQVEIKGSALGNAYALDHYVVEYARGIYPREWTTIVDSTNPVENGTLASWDTDIVQDGKYTLRLTTYDTNGNYNIVQRIVFINKNIHAGWPVKTQDEIIAYPVAADIDKDGFKEVIIGSKNGNLYVYRSSGELLFEKFLDGNIYTPPLVADLDHDGFLEIIVAADNEFTTPPSKVYVFKTDGSRLTGWPKDVNDGNRLALSAGDLDGDGTCEIVAATTRNYGAQKSVVYVWNADGSNYGNGAWPREIELGYPPNVGTAQDYSNHPVLADLDGDGELEIIISVPVYEKGTLYVWNNDGTSFPGWPQDTGDGYTVHPVVGDIDNDGNLEIVGIKKNGRLLVWNTDGSQYMPSEWPRDFAGALSDPVLADLDLDGDLEIVFQSNNGNVYVYNHDGTLLRGWPVDAGTPVGSSEWAPLCVGDVDGDEIPEIIAAGGSNNAIYIWKADGTPFDGWPRILPDSSYASPVIGDIDNDGKVEIVTVYNSSCVLWDLPGTYRKSSMEWPVFQHDLLHDGRYCRLCKADLDNDGDVDGADLAAFANGAGGLPSVSDFARALGRTGLPLYP